MTQSLTNLLCHIVFSTKEREPMITPEIEARLNAYLGGLIRDREGIALEINGMADHVHLLVKLTQKIAIANVMRDLKAISSGWVHDQFRGHRGFAWQHGYAAFSVSESAVADVRQYVRGQKEHHRTVTFQEELLRLLREQRIEFEEEYLWR